MGCSAAYACKSRGADYTLLESNHSVITSSWGESRILRLSYGDPLMVRMMRRSYEIWNAMEKSLNKKLLIPTPVLTLFRQDQTGSMEAFRDQINAFEKTRTGFEIIKKFPGVKFFENDIGLIQNDGACVLASESVSGLREFVGFEEEKVVRLNRERKEIVTESGKIFPYDKVILTAGAWTNKLLVDSGLDTVPYIPSLEQFVYYDEHEGSGKLPIIIEITKQNGRVRGVYSVPHIDGGGVPGVKVGMHCNGELMENEDEFVRGEKVDLSAVANERNKETDVIEGIHTGLDSRMEKVTREFVANHLPGIDASHVSSYGRCIYQCCGLRDGKFLIGIHSQDEDIVIAVGFTGEGFKFGPVIGEFLVQLATGNTQSELCKEMRKEFAIDRV